MTADGAKANEVMLRIMMLLRNDIRLKANDAMLSNIAYNAMAGD